MKISDRLKKFLDKRRRLGLKLLLVSVAAYCLTFITAYMLHRICGGISIVTFLISVYFILVSEHWETRIIKAVKNLMLLITRRILSIITFVSRKLQKAEKLIRAVTKKILYIVSYIIEKIKEKFGFRLIGSYRRGRMAKEYVDIKEKVALNEKKAARKKKKKYKDMDNIEKIRFYYEKRITSAVKKGVEIEESMTPNEAGDKLIRDRQMKNEGLELIDKYNIARYDDKGVITDDMVERVRRL